MRHFKRSKDVANVTLAYLWDLFHLYSIFLSLQYESAAVSHPIYGHYRRSSSKAGLSSTKLCKAKNPALLTSRQALGKSALYRIPYYCTWYLFRIPLYNVIVPALKLYR